LQGTDHGDGILLVVNLSLKLQRRWPAVVDELSGSGSRDSLAGEPRMTRLALLLAAWDHEASCMTDDSMSGYALHLAGASARGGVTEVT